MSRATLAVKRKWVVEEWSILRLLLKIFKKSEFSLNIDPNNYKLIISSNITLTTWWIWLFITVPSYFYLWFNNNVQFIEEDFDHSKSILSLESQKSYSIRRPRPKEEVDGAIERLSVKDEEISRTIQKE